MGIESSDAITQDKVSVLASYCYVLHGNRQRWWFPGKVSHCISTGANYICSQLLLCEITICCLLLVFWCISVLYVSSNSADWSVNFNALVINFSASSASLRFSPSSPLFIFLLNESDVLRQVRKWKGHSRVIASLKELPKIQNKYRQQSTSFASFDFLFIFIWIS